MTEQNITELSSDPKTQGRLLAFRQMIAAIEAKQSTLKERIHFNDGARKACVNVSDRISQLIQLTIKKDQEENVDVEATKAKRDLLLKAKALAEIVGQEHMREELMLQGEARSLLEQAQAIQHQFQMAQGNERRKAEVEQDQEEIRKLNRSKRKSKTKKVEPEVKTAEPESTNEKPGEVAQ